MRFEFWNAPVKSRRVLLLGSDIMGTPIKIAHDLVAEGKRLYELTATPLDDIAALMGVSRWTVQRRIPEWGWAPRTALRRHGDGSVVPPVDPEATPAPPTPEERLALVAYFHRTAKRGLDAVNRILDKTGPSNEAGVESAARALSAMFRAMREMTALLPSDITAPRHEADNDLPPRSIDEYREALAIRIEGIVRAYRSRAGESGSDRVTHDGDQAA